MSACCMCFDWPLKCLIIVLIYFLHGHEDDSLIKPHSRYAKVHNVFYCWPAGVLMNIPHKGFRYAGIQKSKSIFSVCNRQKSFNLSSSHLIHVFLHLAFCCDFDFPSGDRMTLTREPRTILVTEEMFFLFKSCQTFSRKRRAVEYLGCFELIEKRETPIWFLDRAESLISEKCGVNEKQEMWKLAK